MTHAYRFALVALVLCCALPASARPMGAGAGRGMGGPPLMGPPAFLEQVFPPALVMRYQNEIGLTDEQTQAITRAMGETQAKLVDLQWQFEAKSQELTKVLGADTVEEDPALALADKVMSVEQQIKKIHLGLLLRIKNQLTPEQQKKLRELRPARRRPQFRR